MTAMGGPSAELQAGLRCLRDVLGRLTDGLGALMEGAKRMNSLVPDARGRGGTRGFLGPSEQTIVPMLDGEGEWARYKRGRAAEQIVMPAGPVRALENGILENGRAGRTLFSSRHNNQEVVSGASRGDETRLEQMLATMVRLLENAGRADSTRSEASKSSAPTMVREGFSVLPDTTLARHREGSVERRVDPPGARGGREMGETGLRRRFAALPGLRASLLPESNGNSKMQWQPDDADRRLLQRQGVRGEPAFDRREWTRLLETVAATHEGIKRLEDREPVARFG